ncbi:MAG: amylo-alpha-1,6-glucosidase [Nocardioidaceae bacterium]|nr:amylo-alpha-1,6-glucosidase [Nocardioidaceae bacterium]
MSTLQPLLHNLVTTFAAPTQVLAGATGDVTSSSSGPCAEGVWHGDIRVLSDARLRIGGRPPEHIATEIGTQHTTFTSLLREVRAEQSMLGDPQVRLDRSRTVTPGVVIEQLTVASLLSQPADVVIELMTSSDLASIDAVKGGEPMNPRKLNGSIASDGLNWSTDEINATLSAEGGYVRVDETDRVATLCWERTIPARGEVTVSWKLQVTDPGGPLIAAASPGLDAAGIAEDLASRAAASGAGDRRLRPWLEQSLSDLNGLRMASSATPERTFFAAGVPWYLTLFGRDSIWAARLLLGADLGHAIDTVQTLAHFQGAELNVAKAESPGKIMHELRRDGVSLGAMALPPLYFGTIDATPLWISLLHDCWQTGMTVDEVRSLLPHLGAALQWLRSVGDPDGDGFLEYVDESGRGLANQGWKDSVDSIRFADGTIAAGPIALCEVQGYAYEAAVKGAALLDAFDLEGADEWREWASNLAIRFRAAFWCGNGEARYPALALDGSKQRVDAVTSNIGHLLGTGILSPDEEKVVAMRLAAPDMDSGLGLRTMSSASGAYSPLSYHCGSVWPHDTAIVIAAMVKAGLAAHAGGLIEGLLTASEIFDRRLPELWSGEGKGVPYPAACRPQAWSAASAVAVTIALLAGPGPLRG